MQELQEENKRLALKGKEDHLRSMAERDGEVKELHHRLERRTKALTQLKLRTYVPTHMSTRFVCACMCASNHMLARTRARVLTIVHIRTNM